MSETIATAVMLGFFLGVAVVDWCLTRRWHRIKDEAIAVQQDTRREDRRMNAEYERLVIRNKQNFDNAYEALKLNTRAAEVLAKMKDGWVTADSDGKDAIREEYEVIRQEAIDFAARMMVEDLEDELRGEGTTS